MTAATATTPAREAPAPDATAEAPRRAEDLELIGRFEGSGFKDPPYLVRRSDGQVIQLSRLLYLVAEATDGRRDVDAIAERVGRRYGRRATADNIRFLVERKLRPLGVLAGADGSTPELAKRPPLLALRHRRPVLGARVVQSLGAAFAPLFLPPVVIAVVVALGAADVWLFGMHGVAPAVRDALYAPTLLLGLFVAAIGATAFHEVGHAAACRYGGARPGAIGAGIYLVWPAFYCDVTDAYRLGKAGRVRTDLGGIYFNGIVSLIAVAGYFATHREGVLLLAVVQHMTILQQLIPLLRFDGYYILSDLTGVPDILSRIGPILRSLVPFRETEPRVGDLRPRVRAVVTLYIAVLVPVLAVLLTMTVVAAPRVLATAFDSLGLHARRLTLALDGDEWPVAALVCLQVAALVLQCAGIGLIIGRTVRSTARRLRSWSKGSRRRSVIAAAAAVVAAGALAAIWWPSGDYTPLRPGERGTLPQGISGLSRLPAGEPAAAITPQLVRATGLRVPEGTVAAGYGVGRAGQPASPVPAAPAPSAPSTGRPPRTDAPRTPRVPPPSQGPERGETTPPPNSTAPAAPAPTGVGSPAPGPAPAPPPTAAPAPVGSATPSPLPPTAPHDNAAVAANDQDGTLVFALAFDLQRILDGTVDQRNEALAVASCDACRTIAIAVQVLIATPDVHVLNPVNLALSVNDGCTTCQTLAYAYQLLLTMPGDVGITEEGRRKLAEIQRALVLLGTSNLPVTTLYTALDSLMGSLREVVATDVVPISAGTGTTGSGGTSSTDATPTQATPPEGTATAAPSPSGAESWPTPDATDTATPDPMATSDPTATPDPSVTVTPDPTATSTPGTTATPDATATATPDPTATTTPEATSTPTP